jgi:D-alanyl-D-alanine carboxypeptidase
MIGSIITGRFFMKKAIAAVFLILSVICALAAGCGKPGGSENPPDEQSPGAIASPTPLDNVKPTQNVSEDWMLTLVNADNPLTDDYSPELKSLTNGLQFDERAIERLTVMLTAAGAQGLSPVVCSAFRTIERQRTLFNNKAAELTASGLSQTQAEAEALKSIAYPGTSEHNLGLAVDIVALSYQLLDEKQAATPENEWLLEHCAEYGFILRYPKGKEAITGIIYEPWHFRYVGAAAAREIMDGGLCLEEYLNAVNC